MVLKNEHSERVLQFDLFEVKDNNVATFRPYVLFCNCFVFPFFFFFGIALRICKFCCYYYTRQEYLFSFFSFLKSLVACWETVSYGKKKSFHLSFVFNFLYTAKQMTDYMIVFQGIKFISFSFVILLFFFFQVFFIILNTLMSTILLEALKMQAVCLGRFHFHKRSAMLF